MIFILYLCLELCNILTHFGTLFDVISQSHPTDRNALHHVVLIKRSLVSFLFLTIFIFPEKLFWCYVKVLFKSLRKQKGKTFLIKN